MLIAFLSDIHANLPALKAAIADAKNRGVTDFVCAGDVTGNGPSPNEVCNYLEKHKISAIAGNYDIKVLNLSKQDGPDITAIDAKKKESLLWTVKTLNQSARDFLRGLPEKIERELPGKRNLLVVHGSPVSNEDNVYPSITNMGLAAKLGSARPDILVCGHTHVPFLKSVGGTLVINCGSVGQPVDGDPRPAYALVSIEQKTVRGRIVRFEYDVNKAVAALRKTPLPKGLQKDLIEGIRRRLF